jgi:hypothetical protein
MARRARGDVPERRVVAPRALAFAATTASPPRGHDLAPATPAPFDAAREEAMTGRGERGADSPLARRAPALPLVGVLAVLAFTLVPPARGHAILTWTLVGAAGLLAAWWAILMARASSQPSAFRVEFASVKAHWVQGLVQFGIYAYWGWYWRDVYEQAPLILAQVLYIYAFDGLLSWSRGRPWRIGFGPWPVIFSTNLLLWFRDDVFFLQFAMITVGALGKEFIRWKRDGRYTHIFNPSVFGQASFALVLIATGTTSQLTHGEDIAIAFEKLPDIFPVLFVFGLVVQYLFSVTLMTLAATATLCLINLVYLQLTDTYFFVSINIGATVFLGLHLLMTDPSTSPRTYTGKVVFGALYALGYSFLFALFDATDIPLFWDKLLPVPILNLLVPVLDRIARGGAIGAVNRRWEGALPPRRANLVHMAIWGTLFLTMIGTGFVEGRHEGRSLVFWREKYKEGVPNAGRNLLLLAQFGAENDSGEAFNMLGKLCIEGELVPKDEAAAAYYFARACELGDVIGCENVMGQFFSERRAHSEESVKLALDRLEVETEKGRNAIAMFFVALAYESGTFRERDLRRAHELYDKACTLGYEEACLGRERLARFLR